MCIACSFPRPLGMFPTTTDNRQVRMYAYVRFVVCVLIAVLVAVFGVHKEGYKVRSCSILPKAFSPLPTVFRCVCQNDSFAAHCPELCQMRSPSRVAQNHSGGGSPSKSFSAF